MEQEIVGVGISPHPLIALRKHSTHRLTEIADLVVGNKETVLVQIQTVRIIRTKNWGADGLSTSNRYKT